MKTFCFDVDNTILKWNEDRDYVNFEPNGEMVELINQLYDEGHTIILHTARGMTSVMSNQFVKKIYLPLLESLEKIGLKYHDLIVRKPHYDFVIDDKALRPDEFMELAKSGMIHNHKPYVPE